MKYLTIQIKEENHQFKFDLSNVRSFMEKKDIKTFEQFEDWFNDLDLNKMAEIDDLLILLIDGFGNTKPEDHFNKTPPPGIEDLINLLQYHPEKVRELVISIAENYNTIRENIRKALRSRPNIKVKN